MPLEEYRAKRDFAHTPEPVSGAPATDGALTFVVQKHDARALHYDFRLELDGVLVSWAVPKGPSLDPHDKRLAVHVEDHPLDYGGFEGTIPAGEYGAGSVILWDRGTWQPLGDPHAGMARGDFKFSLQGEKLRGLWVLVRLKPRHGEKRENWLLIKERDEFARPREEYDVLAEQPDSVLGAEGDGGNPADPQPSSAPTPFPATVDLELATLVDRPPDGEEWVAEVKYDGYRVVLALDGGQARAFTRSHADWSDRFSGLTRAAAQLPASSAVIDGEAVVFDAQGVSRFELLQKELGQHPEKVAFAAFDLLYLNGYDLRDLPLTQRKELLRDLLAEQPATAPIRYADHVAGGGAEFYRHACLADLEGIVCKRANSPYAPGRGREWVKIKCRQSQELVVGGFTEGAGSRAALGSVLVGTYDGERLAYAGRIGSGFDEATVASLRARLDALERPDPPFDPAPHITGHIVHWTSPEVVIEAAFREWTAEGVLRQPVFLGVREDKPATDVVRERPTADEPAVSLATPVAVAAGDHTSVLGVRITNPDKLLFPESPGFTKLDFARYYAAIAPLMLPEVAERPLTLLRCPVGQGQDCFYQRHPDAGLPAHVHRLKHTLKSEPVELLYVDSAEGLVALAQMGAGEVHAWLSRTDAPTRPDRICFDLDPGPDVAWAQIRSAALLVREECERLGFSAFLKSTGSKGLHVVLPIEPVWEFDRVRAFSKHIVDRLVARHPEALVGKMAKDARGGRVFFDYLRNAEGASAVAAYSTRMKPGPSCAVPLAWDELTDDLDIRTFTPERVLARAAAGTDPWRGLADAGTGAKLLRSAEQALEG
ncbi:MAG TPA: DNA ligase D [Coriobacteriia bacterium]